MNLQEVVGERGGKIIVSVLLSDQSTKTIIDADDVPILGDFTWHPKAHGNRLYVRAKIGRDWVYLHRRIMTPPTGMVVDHKDHDSLNNTRENLRVVTQRVNCWNTEHCRSGHGMKNGKWRARIRHDGKRLELGFYETEREAAAAYATAARILRGSFAARHAGEYELPMFRFPPVARRVLIQRTNSGATAADGH